MSFTYDVKQEIAQLRPSGAAEMRAQGYGLFLFSKEFSPERIRVQTENEYTAQVASDLLEHLHLRPDCRRSDGRESPVYKYTLDKPDDCSRLLAYFGCRAAVPVNRRELRRQRNLSFFLGGAFLACGSVTDPAKSYHLEFAVPDEALCDELEELAGAVAPFKRSQRKGVQILYLKESEQIEDMLTFLGATHASLTMMEVKIYKDFRNKANRQTNCETANIDKTINAAANQAADIELLVERLGWEGIPDDLRELARLRLENPDYSLREIGEALRAPMSRSGVSHRFQRLKELADRERG